MGSCSRIVLLVVNLIAAILAIAIIGITLNALYNSKKSTPALAGLPTETYHALIAFGAIVFFISMLGVSGTCLKSKLLLSLFIIVDLVIAIAILILGIFALYTSNGGAIGKDIQNGVGLYNDLIQETLFNESMINNPKNWNVTQDVLDCCGVDVESTYANYTQYNFASYVAFIEALHPGNDCAAGRAAIIGIHASNPTYSANVEAIADGNPALKLYFCKDVITKYAAETTLYAGIICVVLVVIMVSTTSAAIILMTKVTTRNGGFVKPPEETGNSLAYGGPQVNAASAGNALA